ncbi:SRPBCC domain-containing protein [uncultured Bdellovibrio sp.]|uniref:SRPBCC domain-containing protein n=1 Tax=Bdellovibrio sp. HCB-162 TaxID=3394234 RepID=UPI0025F946CA|nr:SRPBCC domain-containing protein [uncultured Bdellovibrio sp.]
MCKTIKQKVHFKAPPDVIYSLLTDSKKYALLTGKKAKIGKSAGDPFSVYGGQATGIIVELVRNKRIVQAWRGHSFPEGIFSMATFNLKPIPKNGTELVLVHRGVPKEMIPSIERGWRKYNWDLIKSYLEKKK